MELKRCINIIGRFYSQHNPKGPQTCHVSPFVSCNQLTLCKSNNFISSITMFLVSISTLPELPGYYVVSICIIKTNMITC
ncbi:hypothetical protein BRADI_1g01835v3 [Brachypodium distachyon]|uniref:Uncharacterized protein n=1 Tax=Brachypodium distachyon TaxID=15368 RepID=A0A2K2DHQ1_BRADI|nr:hypothetical protein BRADI_1g01835v3 [Brachypodium distachyon]